MKFSRLILTAVLFGATASATMLPMQAAAAQSLEEKKKARPVEVMSERVGKKVAEAVEFLTPNEEEGREADPKAAIRLLEELEPKKEFDKAYLSQLIGKLYAQEGDYDKAISKIKYAADLDILSWDDQAGVYKLLAILNLQEEKYQATIDAYNQWFAFTEKHDPTVYSHKALAYYQLKEYDKTIENADLAIQYAKEPKADPYQLKMSAYVDQKNYKGAIEVTTDAIKVFPEDKKWWIPLAQFYLMTEDYERSLSTFELAEIQGFLTKPTHFTTLAQLYSMNGIPYKAAVTMEKHIESGLLEKNAKNMGSTANYFHQASEYDKAAKTYLAAAKLDNDAEFYRKSGDLFSVSEKYKSAIASYNKALEYDSPKKGSINVALIEAHFNLGNYKKAYEHAQEGLKSNQHKRVAKGWLSYIKDTAERKKISIN
ncbi:tetratricopeptide repeat protein [Catenovulum adriaticum]|uniref:Tetratricopeptide repeat protein n=1 Tax=Catenovulum adriaticum TaxID=2984846 RepID=A0ABY7AKQ7_9ALTE|nr:tetratricopeptide repeat protein [Catenovulum sp. TS8]WAJ69327.1 tetratricopeptide repeat protein [Catenovulum sp. TS8]